MTNIFLKILLLASLSLAFLTGCASQGAQPTGSKASAPESEAGAATEMPTREEIKAQAQEIPERPMDAEVMALLLEAELALYRNNLELALEIYEDLTSTTEDVGIARRTAEIAMATGDPFRFLDAALYYRELAPEDDRYAFELAVRSLARSAEIEGAWALLSEHPERTYELRLASSEAVRLAGQMEDNYQIEWLLENIISAYGEDTQDQDVLLSLGIIHEALGNYEQAGLFAEKASAAEPENLLAFRLHVNSLINSGNTEEAARVITQWIEDHPEEDETRISLAKTLVTIDQEAALPVLEDLIEDYPWSGDLLLITAQLHLGSEQPENAIPFYRRLTQQGEHRAIAFFNMARIYEQQGNLELAAQHYAQLSPEDITEDDMDMLFEAQFRLARLKYLIDGDENGEGHEVFEELRAANPDQAITLFIEEARLLMDLDREADTVELLGQALEVYPDNESLLYSRSLAYERNGQTIQAQDDLRSILANDENNSTALNALGYMLTNNNGDLQEAYDLIDRALELSPEDPAIIDSMGWVLFRMGRYEEALEYLERANDALLDEEVISHLAETLHVLGRTDEAREVLAQGLEDLPDSDMIPETRARLGLDD